MQLARPAFAIDPRSFGRGQRRILAEDAPTPISSDIKLFATTFLAGFVVVSILIS